MLLQKTINLPAEQVVLSFSDRHPIVQLPASISIQYFEKEDTADPKSAPLKITISVGLNEWREYSLTIKQLRALLYFLGKVVRQRTSAGGQISDGQFC